MKARMAEERRPGDGFGHRFGFAAFKKMRRLNNAAQEDVGFLPQVNVVILLMTRICPPEYGNLRAFSANCRESLVCAFRKRPP